MIASVMPVGTGLTGRFHDAFQLADGSALDSGWSAATWVHASNVPRIKVVEVSPGKYRGMASDSHVAFSPADPDPGIRQGSGAIHSQITDIDTAYPYTFLVKIHPPSASGFEEHGVRFYCRLAHAQPIPNQAGGYGVYLSIDWTSTTAATTTVYKYVNGASSQLTSFQKTGLTASPIWLKVRCNGTAVDIYWNGDRQTTQTGLNDGGSWTAANATQFAFGFFGSKTIAGADQSSSLNYGLIDEFILLYTSSATAAIDKTYPRLVAAANGTLYEENDAGDMGAVSGSLTVSANTHLQAAEFAGKLYIADYDDERCSGTDGTVTTGTGVFDDVAGKNWSTLGVDADDDLVVLWDGTVNVGADGVTQPGAYKITSVSSTTITLADVDTGTDGTAFSFRIERGPKIYDPSAGTLTLWSQDIVTGAPDKPKGSMPTGCPLIAVYRGRLVLAGRINNPHIWYMSRVNDPNDWDLGADFDDTTRAMAGTSTGMSVIGQPLTALISYLNDYLIFACRHQLWVMRGDPAAGGTLTNLSYAIGVVDKFAWCHGPSGEIVFLSDEGLYVIPPGATSEPMPISEAPLPEELEGIDPQSTLVTMAFDHDKHGVHIYLSDVDEIQDGQHWWLQWDTKTFWPVSLQSDHQVHSVGVHQVAGEGGRTVLLGGRDGYIRRYGDEYTDDDGNTLSSYVQYGPMALGRGGQAGLVSAFTGVLSSDSADVTTAIQVGGTHETAASADAFTSATLSAGDNYWTTVRGRGTAYVVKLTGTGQWAVERITVETQPAGKHRKL